MRESKTIAAVILGAACACEPSPGPPPSAPAAVVPVSAASAAPLAVEPAPPAASASAAEEDHDAPPPDLASHSEPNGPPPPAPSNGAPFDRGRAAAALGSVNVQACANATGPRGTGRVTVTFATSGRARAVVLEQGPFTGTTVGSCIMSRYRVAQVPPFGGAEVRVRKSFTVQ